MWKITLENDRLIFTPFFGDLAGQDPNDEITADQLIHTLKSRDSEIRDLKLENDRLQQQNELMKEYIHAIACVKSKKSKYYGLCEESNCPYFDHDKEFGQGACTLRSMDLIEQEAADIIEKLEDLG